MRMGPMRRSQLYFFTVIDALFCAPLSVAVILPVADEDRVCPRPLTINVAEVWPAGIVTVAGTVAEAESSSAARHSRTIELSRS